MAYSARTALSTPRLGRSEASQPDKSRGVVYLNEIVNSLVEQEIVSIQLYPSLKIFLIRLN